MAVVSFEDLERPAVKMQTIDGILKWFDHARGYGFIIPQGGDEDILIYDDVLRESGFRHLNPGAALSCEIVNSAKGLVATRVLKVFNMGRELIEEMIPEEKLLPRGVHPQDISPEDLKLVIVKWYDEKKGYGFAVPHDDDGDVMLSRQILRRCGIRGLFPGDKVRCVIESTPRGRLAIYIDLL